MIGSLFNTYRFGNGAGPYHFLTLSDWKLIMNQFSINGQQGMRGGIKVLLTNKQTIFSRLIKQRWENIRSRLLSDGQELNRENALQLLDWQFSHISVADFICFATRITRISDLTSANAVHPLLIKRLATSYHFSPTTSWVVHVFIAPKALQIWDHANPIITLPLSKTSNIFLSLNS